MTGNHKKISVFLIPLLLLIAAAICSVIISTTKSNDYKGWQEAQATVLRWEELKKHNTRVHFTYTVDGQLYSGSELFHDSPDNPFPTGSQKTVWYDPDDPTRVSFYEPDATLDTIAPFFIAVPLAIACFFNARVNRDEYVRHI